MGTSSARPDDLDRFASRSRNADDALRDHNRRLRSTYADFQSGTEWGVLDIHSMLAGFGTFIEYNEIDARWVARIADAFRRAGGDGSVKTLPDAAIHASLRAAGLLGGRQSVTFDDPVAYGMPPTTGYANDPVNTASGNFVELEDDLPFAGLTAGLTFARMYNSRSDRSGAFGTGWSSWADARLNPRQDGAEYVGPDGQRALFPRMGEGYGRVLGVAGLVEPGPSGLVLNWFGGERWEFDEAGLPVRVTQGPGHRRAASRTRTGAWPSCATRAARPCACTGARTASRRSSAPTGAPWPIATTTTASWSRPAARATTRSARARCSRSPTPTASSRSRTPTTSRAASCASSPRSAATPCSATCPAR